MGQLWRGEAEGRGTLVIEYEAGGLGMNQLGCIPRIGYLIRYYNSGAAVFILRATAETVVARDATAWSRMHQMRGLTVEVLVNSLHATGFHNLSSASAGIDRPYERLAVQIATPHEVRRQGVPFPDGVSKVISMLKVPFKDEIQKAFPRRP